MLSFLIISYSLHIFSDLLSISLNMFSTVVLISGFVNSSIWGGLCGSVSALCGLIVCVQVQTVLFSVCVFGC